MNRGGKIKVKNMITAPFEYYRNLNFKNFSMATATSSVSNLTKKECRDMIISLTKKLESKKWYQYKKPIINDLLYWVKQLNEIENKS